MTIEGGRGRAFVLYAGFFGGMVAGAWLGLVLARIADYFAASHRLRFPSDEVLAALVAGGALLGICVLVHRAGGRSPRNDLLFATAFSVFLVLYSIDNGVVSLLSHFPALLVSFLLALAAVRRSPLLRLAGLAAGSLYMLGVVVSLAQTF